MNYTKKNRLKFDLTNFFCLSQTKSTPALPHIYCLCFYRALAQSVWCIREKPQKKMNRLTKYSDCVFVVCKDGKNVELYEDSSPDCAVPTQILLLVPIILYCVYNHGILCFVTVESTLVCFLLFLFA